MLWPWKWSEMRSHGGFDDEKKIFKKKSPKTSLLIGWSPTMRLRKPPRATHAPIGFFACFKTQFFTQQQQFVAKFHRPSTGVGSGAEKSDCGVRIVNTTNLSREGSVSRWIRGWDIKRLRWHPCYMGQLGEFGDGATKHSFCFRPFLSVSGQSIVI